MKHETNQMKRRKENKNHAFVPLFHLFQLIKSATHSLLSFVLFLLIN